MKNTATYYDLFRILVDIDRQAAEHASFRMLNSTRIDWFMKANQGRIHVMNAKNQELAMAYCKKDGNGRPVMLILENGQNALDFETPEDKEKYEVEFKTFMNQNIDIFT